jgi:eukaryotic-like serine/threonine-protein kinase
MCFRGVVFFETGATRSIDYITLRHRGSLEPKGPCPTGGRARVARAVVCAYLFPLDSQENHLVLALRPGRVVAGKYRLDQALARGGMGSLWIAFDRRLRRKVAIKFINSMSAPLDEASLRFEREAQAAAQIRSPHVIQTYDYGIDRGHAYIVMELLEGEDLGARLLREKRLPIGAVSRVLGQIAKGLDEVHAAGIVHRDLKPGNVFIAQVAGEEMIKLIDFGVARADVGDGRRVTGGAIVGTIKYMAPEQALGDEALDHRADLWSLAVIAYRLLTGQYPFQGSTPDEVVLAIRQDPVKPPSAHVAGLAAGVDAFFKRAFARAPDQRFQTAGQMASSFMAFATARNRTLPWGTPAVRGPAPSGNTERGAINTPPDSVVEAEPAMAVR